MSRTIVYWTGTGLVALALLAALSYLTGSEEVVSGFAKAGYPQYLRIVLGIVKPIAAIVLLAPRLPLLKEWAYAGATFTWIICSCRFRGSSAKYPCAPKAALLISTSILNPAVWIWRKS